MTDPKLEAVSDVPVPSMVEAPAIAVPNLRVTDEAFVWRSDYFARILVDLADVDPRFKRRLAGELSAGLVGRGKAGIDEDNLLRIVFGLTDVERTDEGLLDLYVRGVLAYVGAEPSAVVYASVDRVAVPPEVDAQIDASVRALGLRAITSEP